MNGRKPREQRVPPFKSQHYSRQPNYVKAFWRLNGWLYFPLSIEAYHGRGEYAAMRLTKPCVIVSTDRGAGDRLNKVMLKNGLFFADFAHFNHAQPALQSKADADLILIESSVPGEDGQHIAALRSKYAEKAITVIDPSAAQNREDWIKRGADEALTPAEFDSDLGRRLIEKLIDGKRHQNTEAQIEQGEERFKGIIEYAHDVILLLDNDATIIYTSPAFGRQLQFQTWEVLGSALYDFTHPEDKAKLKATFPLILKSDASSPIQIEFRMKRSGGEWRDVEAIASNLLSNATVGAVVFNFRDVTRQKQAERELEKHQKNLESLIAQRTLEVEQANKRIDAFLAASPDTLIAIDEDGFISFASKHYSQRYPHEAATFQPGRHILDAFDVIARNIFLSKDDPLYDDMRSWWQKPQGTREFRLAGGMWTRMQAKPVPGSKEIVISTTDITDYKRQQAKLAAQSADLAMALVKEKEIVEQQKTFVSMVSHEFRTPLTIIDGNAQIIQKRGDTIGQEALEKRAGTIRSAVDRLVRLIETILSAHMLDSGKLTITRGPCDLAAIIRECCADHQDISPRHKIDLQIGDLPSQAMLDTKVMRQAMTNLLSNAVKYAPDNPDISVRAGVDTVSGDIMIVVTDHGVGIPKDELPKIFGKYFRASTSGGIPGSGLGLSLVKQLIELHNGGISIESQVGQGTSVTIKLPIEKGVN
jgi:PAS domain S-box-containing protein